MHLSKNLAYTGASDKEPDHVLTAGAVYNSQIKASCKCSLLYVHVCKLIERKPS